MEAQIVNPNVNPDETRLKHATNNVLFEMLKKELPKYSSRLMDTSKGMHQGLHNIYIDGMAVALLNWGDFAKAKAQFMASAQEFIEVLTQWEKKFIEWQVEVNGEEVVKELLSKALKNAEEKGNKNV